MIYSKLCRVVKYQGPAEEGREQPPLVREAFLSILQSSEDPNAVHAIVKDNHRIPYGVGSFFLSAFSLGIGLMIRDAVFYRDRYVIYLPNAWEKPNVAKRPLECDKALPQYKLYKSVKDDTTFGVRPSMQFEVGAYNKKEQSRIFSSREGPAPDQIDSTSGRLPTVYVGPKAERLVERRGQVGLLYFASVTPDWKTMQNDYELYARRYEKQCNPTTRLTKKARYEMRQGIDSIPASTYYMHKPLDPLGLSNPNPLIVTDPINCVK